MFILKANKRRFLLCALFAAVVAMIKSFQFYGSPLPTNELFGWAYYGSISNNDLALTVTVLLVFFIPVIPALDFFRCDIETVTTYCLTRSKSRFSWLMQKYSAVLIAAAISAVTFHLCITAVFLSLRLFSFSELAATAMMQLQMLLLLFLYWLLLSLLLNVFSILFQSKWSLVAGVFITLLISVHYLFSANHCEYFPLDMYSHLCFSEHPEIAQYTEAYDFLFMKTNTPLSLLYFIVCIAAVAVTGWVILKKTDIGLLKED